MLRGGKSTQKRHGGANATASEEQPFDPAAYAALIAIEAAKKRLRASHSRGSSSSTAPPSSAHRPPPNTPSPGSNAGECLTPPPLQRQPLPSHTVRDSLRVEAIVARYRPHPQPAAAAEENTDAGTSSRTLLEQLAVASDSASSVASETNADAVMDAHITAVELSAERAPSSSAPPHRNRSFSLPVPPPLPAVRHPSPLPSSSTSSSSSPPVEDPTAKATAHEARHQLAAEGDGCGGDTAVSLRDASPLREQSVAGVAGMSFRVSAVESVHTVAQQLNFALYQ